MIRLAQLSTDLVAAPVSPSTSVSSASPTLLILIGVIVVVALVAFLLVWRRVHLRKHRKAGGNLQMTILRIRLPQFFAKQSDENTQLSGTQEDIAVAETFFSAIGGMPAQKGMKAWLHGRTDQFSFEIVARGGVIYFYAAVPAALEELVTQQLHAQFPNAEIEVDEDYNIFSPVGVTVGSYVTFKRQNLFPIKTYRQLESDPLNALLNALAKVPQDEGAAIQFTMRSARATWRDKGLGVTKRMYEGATVEEALKGKSPKTDKGSGIGLGGYLGGGKDDQGQQQEQVRRLSQREEEMVKSIEEKASRAGLDVNIRVIASGKQLASAQASLNNILNSFAQYNVYQYGNSFKKDVPRNAKRIVHDFIFRNFVEHYGVVLSTDEVSSLWHPPLPGTEAASVDWLTARKSGAPTIIPKEGFLLGYNNYRGRKTEVNIKRSDRQRHMYFIGKSGSGKSTELQALALQDIRKGEGVCVVDPHGDMVEYLLGLIPRERIKDVIVFQPYDRDMPIGLNMLESPTPELVDLTVGDMISIFYKLFPPEMIGPMFEHQMRNVMLTLMSDPNEPGTIAEIPRMFSDEDYQKRWIAKVSDPVVRSFWEQEMANTSDYHKSEMLGYLISKVGRFVEDGMIRNIIGQSRSGFSFREIMDQQKILLIDLSKGKTGEMNAQLLGLIIVSKIQLAAMARADMAEEDRKDFYLYIDEFQNFVTPSIATILSEARKYRLNLVMAHQYMSQVVERGDTEIRDAILGNVGSMFVSRIGPEDTDTFEKVFAPTFNANDLINSDKFTWYVKMTVDNSQVPPFTMNGLSPEESNPVLAQKVRQLSRVTYGRKRSIVEREIAIRSGFTSTKPAAAPPPPPAPAPPVTDTQQTPSATQ